MYIILMRHGDAFKATDNSCPLSEVGVRQVERVCEFLDLQSIDIQSICHSQKTRAQQTAGIVATNFKKSERLKYVSSLDPDMDPDIFMDELAYYEENTMFVGHLPTIQMFLHTLLESNTEAMPPIYFEPATVVILEKHANDRWGLVSHFKPDMAEF